MSNPNGRWEFDKDGNVRYVPPDGSGESSYTPPPPPTGSNTGSSTRSNTGTTKKTTKKTNNDWHWIVIVLAFMVAWPVGLVLLFLELSGKWPGSKQVERELDRAANGIKNVAKQAQQKYSAGKTTGKTASPPPFAATAAAAAATPPPTAEKKSGAKETKKSGKKTAAQEAKQYGLGNIKLFRILGWSFTGIFGFASIMELVEELAHFTSLGYMVENLVPLLAFVIVGLAFLGVAGGRSRKLKKFRKYKKLIGAKDEIPLSALAKTMGLSEKKVMDDVEEMLERDVFETGYIDVYRNMLILHDPELEPSQPEAPVESGDEKAADSTLRRIRKINDAIENPEISAKIDRIESLTAKIFRLLEEKPEKAGELRSFMNYYLPQTLKILENYATLEAQGIEGDNIAEAKLKIEGMMDKVVDGYETQLDKLFADDVLDISADLKVMESMLAKDGLTVDNDFQL